MREGFAFDRDSLNWHGGALLATWFMTLVIQRAEHRDTQAVHAKLDELLHAQGSASSQLTKIDKKDAEEIEKHRKIARANDQLGNSRSSSASNCAKSLVKSFTTNFRSYSRVSMMCQSSARAWSK